MPNTKPVNDDVAVTHFVRARDREANRATVYPIGAITKGSVGRELTDYLALKEAGCVAVSDGGHPGDGRRCHVPGDVTGRRGGSSGGRPL